MIRGLESIPVMNIARRIGVSGTISRHSYGWSFQDDFVEYAPDGEQVFVIVDWMLVGQNNQLETLSQPLTDQFPKHLQKEHAK